MIVEPKVRGFVCTTAHPAGCAVRVESEIRAARALAGRGRPVRALVVGASQGYGLSARIALAFGLGSPTLGVFLEKPPSPGRTASAGWYSTAAFAAHAAEAGLECPSLNADAFAPETLERALREARERWGGLDLLVWSLAAPRGVGADGRPRRSVLKPVGAPLEALGLDPFSGTLRRTSLPAATEEEIEETVAVMGGAPWARWTRAVAEAGLAAPGFRTVAFSYEGSPATRAIYRDGTIGRAKEDLERTALELDRLLAPLGGRAFASLEKACPTQSAAAIPSVALYTALLGHELRKRGLDEDCGAQMRRLLSECLFADPVPVDALGRIRLDDRELLPEVQRAVERGLAAVEAGEAPDEALLAEAKADFLRIFGFGIPGVDESAEAETDLPIAGLLE